MLSTLHCLGVCAVLFLLAPPTTSFSGGASHASCQEMIPGHIRAHSQDSQHRQVTIRTSASSYLPGQFITGTISVMCDALMVRSSRDFMGFLLQSRRQGPLLVGGSWILTPPGTHTLCCLSEGDTVTHSDKQLKRNLSFVWRAPDSPVGDIRFYITVVQSYFVYWAGIESGLVRDAGRRLWNGSNTTRVNGVSAISALLQDKVTALPSLPLVTMHASIRSTFVIPSSFTRNQLTSSARFALPSPSPISNPPYLSSSQPTPTSPQPSSFASSTIPYLYTSNHPSSDLLFTPAPLPTFTSSQCITNSSISFVSSTTSSSSTSATSSSYQGTSFYIPSVTSPPAAQATSLHSGPSPAPRRSLHNLSMPSPSQKHTEGHTASSDPDPSIHPPTPRTDIHPNPKPHPNIEENLGHELKPKLPNSDAKHPSSPPATPDKEGKYPDIRRHSAWELGMLLGSSAGLGMVLVVGIRYLYRQACGKRTAVTLNDREREYGRGEIGLIHVQECGDLVRVRKIRENSLVLLAEYDVLSPPGERNAGCQQR
ncbi:reelin domain-containing protein 1-like [Haplochromis burtoni]|uniref:reelin domain-containing protein 1-like n=1 Tax=Haplochromis burtoni TaxID=8153 RepID=UPI001C2D3F52|nr:reelin domain-containing protein 1-like [Haplochromis burtoni]